MQQDNTPPQNVDYSFITGQSDAVLPPTNSNNKKFVMAVGILLILALVLIVFMVVSGSRTQRNNKISEEKSIYTVQQFLELTKQSSTDGYASLSPIVKEKVSEDEFTRGIGEPISRSVDVSSCSYEVTSKGKSTNKIIAVCPTGTNYIPVFEYTVTYVGDELKIVDYKFMGAKNEQPA